LHRHVIVVVILNLATAFHLPQSPPTTRQPLQDINTNSNARMFERLFKDSRH
jgi:hypothetical protein